MARYVMSNRRAGRFRESDQRASRGAMSATLQSLPGEARIVGDNAPDDALARHTVLFEADPVEVAALRASAPDTVIIEPEIVHHHLTTCPPPDFLGTAPARLDALREPDAASRTPTTRLRATLVGGGAPLANAEAQLFLRGDGGVQRRLVERSDAAGRVAFAVPAPFVPALMNVVPAAGFWSVGVRAPRDGQAIDCPALPADGPIGWWHRAVGAARPGRTRGRGLRVGVVDTGVGPHPALDHVVDIGSFIDGVFDRTGGADSDVHGSHVCGTVGARPVEGGRYAGIAPGARLYSARVFPPDSGANQMDISDAIDTLSRDHAVDLINLSLGAPVGSEIERDAIRDALERGTLCVCAAGNANGPVGFPAAFPETVAVAALGLEGWGPPGSLSAGRLPESAARFGTGNLYLANFSDFGPEITCAAPGVGIVSTVPASGAAGGTSGNPYAALDGTSMASPVACGALAARLAGDALYRTLPRDETRAAYARRALIESCRDIGLDPAFQGRGVPTLGVPA